jgi:integrase
MPIRKRGPWWHYRFVIAGQECAGSTELPATEANRKAAERFEKAQRELAKQGRLTEARKDFATAAGEFILWCKDVEYRQKPSTAERISVSFASLVDFLGDMHVVSIGAGEVERYKAHRIQVNGVKDVTLRHDLHALSLFFQYAETMRWREGNPVRQVSMPSDAEAVRMNPPTAEEEQAYFTAAFKVTDRAGRHNLYDAGKTIREEGCRPDEIMSARKCDLDPIAATLAIPGGKSRAARRTLYLTPEVLEILRARLQTEGPWLFPSERYSGRHITKLNNSHDRACREATVAWKAKLEKAGRPQEAREASVSFVLYDLRHAFGTYHATVLKTDPFTLAGMMGHANLRTIMRYVHPDQQRHKEAMERYAAAMRQGKLRRVK